MTGRPLTTAMVKRAVAAAANVSVEALTGRRQNRDVAWPRMAAMYLCRERAQLSSGQIGRAFNRDHTTVLAAIRRVRALMYGHPSLVRLIQDAERRLDREAEMPPPEDAWADLDLPDTLVAMGREIARLGADVRALRDVQHAQGVQIRALARDLVAVHADVAAIRQMAAGIARLERAAATPAGPPEPKPAATAAAVAAPAPAPGPARDPRPATAAGGGRRMRRCIGPLCLGQHEFESEGRHNRLCPACTRAVAERARAMEDA